MDSRATHITLVVIVLMLLTCIVGLGLGLPQLEHQRARARWEQRHPRHYTLDASWQDGLGTARHVHLEVRDNRVVAGVDRDTGDPLSPLQVTVAARFVSVDALFEHIAVARRPPPTWRDQLARTLPALAPLLSPCLRPVPDVRYDPELGYPVHVHPRASPCIAPLLYQEDVRIDIERLQPLPEATADGGGRRVWLAPTYQHSRSTQSSSWHLHLTAHAAPHPLPLRAAPIVAGRRQAAELHAETVEFLDGRRDEWVPVWSCCACVFFP